MLAILWITAILLTQVPIKHNGQNEELPIYKLGTKNVIYSDHNINRIVPGYSFIDSENMRIEQENRRIREMAIQSSNRNSIAREGTRQQGLQMCRESWNETECQIFDKIINKESGYNQYARNGNCCGVGQRLNWCSEAQFKDLDGQFREIIRYIRDRYQTPSEAWKHHNIFNWY